MADTQPKRPPRKLRGRRIDAPDSTGPIDIAMGRVTDQGAATDAATILLCEQVELVRDDRRHRALQITSARMGIALKSLIALAGGLAVAALVAMAVTAANDHGLVIDTFSVPPDLAQRGVTGRVLASRLQDKLAALDAQTQSSRPARTYANDWSGDIKVQIPETGVSVGEFTRALHDWLGDATHVEGEAFRTARGLTLSARAGAAQGVEATGSEDDLDALVQKIALGLFERTQPYRYALWLNQRGRGAESIAALKALAAGPDPEERYWAAFGLSNMSDFRLTLRVRHAYALEATALQPYRSGAWSNLSVDELLLGHREAALVAARRALAERPKMAGQGLSENAVRFNQQSGDLTIGELLADYGFARAAARKLSRNPFYTDTRAGALELAELMNARRHVAPRPLPPMTPGLLASMLNWGHLVRAQTVHRALQGDWGGVAADLEALKKADFGAARGDVVPAIIDPMLAEAYARLGRRGEAEALLRAVPRDSLDGWLARGRVAALRGDWAGAEARLAEAIRQSPSLPFGYFELAKVRAAKGDPAAAAALFRQASGRGPRWADPLKCWGDVLLRQGDPGAAERRYGEAAARAPRWGALHLAWSDALWRLDRRDEARAKLRAAAGMDLSAGDRARLGRMRAKAGA